MQNLHKENSSDSRTEFWGICCESGKRYSQIVGKKFHISMAVLDLAEVGTSPVVSLMLEHEGSQYLLCSLKKDSLWQVLLNLYFDKGENVTFFLKGQGTVHLSGYYVCDKADDKNLKNNKKDPVNKLVGKGGKANFTVSADVESSSEETSDETNKAVVKASPTKASPVPAKNAKAVVNNKPKVPLTVAKQEEESSEEDDSDYDPTKDLTASLAKDKEEESSEDEDLFDDEEDLEEEDDDGEDESDEDEEEATQQPGAKRGHSAVESDEEDSSDYEDSSDNGGSFSKLKAGLNKAKELQQKKLKTGPSTPSSNSKGGKKSITNNMNDGKPDLNSSIGRTPMPKKPKSSSVESFLAEMKQQSKTPNKDTSKLEDANTSATKTPEKPNSSLNTSVQSESGKKKKNKKKNKEGSENQNSATPNKTPAKQYSHKLPGGIEYEDIRPGNGLVAKKGKLVHVYYTGQLENNKVFDSCQQGQKPFSFKLASGQVIKGWDLGIEGMKVGGKRRLKIPPHMGYANKRTGPIPPNSTLYFTVELKAVS